MKRLNIICSTLLLAPALALNSAQARAEFKCDDPQSRIDRVACEKASESPQALRHYIQRMRPIHSLYFPDYVNEAQARAWAENDSNRAPAHKATAQTAVFLPEDSGA